MDQLGSYSSLLTPSVQFAHDRWNAVWSGPHAFSFSPDIDDSYNFVKPALLQQILDETGSAFAGVALLCRDDLPGDDDCTSSLVEPLNAQDTELLTYAFSDHIRRDFDVDRNASINVIDLFLVAQLAGTCSSL